MSKEKYSIPEGGLYDAKQLGIPKMIILGIQHTFAMFGATVLVPMLTGLDVSTTLLMAGIGTLLFHFITKGKVPAFLGSSFAFIAGIKMVAWPKNADGVEVLDPSLLPYACGGIVLAGLVYVVMALLVKVWGVKKIMRFFPPVVTGPIIISIGLILAPTAINSAKSDWLLAIIALVVIIACNIWGKGMIKIVPILLGILVSYAVALILGKVDFEAVNAAKLLAPAPLTMAKFSISAAITIVPIALATMMEHIGDIAAIGATTKKNYFEEPGLHRTLIGDGLATSIAGMVGGPANTTYGENTGVLALTRVYDPRVMQIASVFAICLSFIPKFGAIVNTIPAAIIGGVSFILYGMISAIGVRNVVENQVDFTNSRNLIIAAVILVSALGFSGIGGVTIAFSSTFQINLSGLAIAAILGITLNAVLPGNTYEFGKDLKGDTSVKFTV